MEIHSPITNHIIKLGVTIRTFLIANVPCSRTEPAWQNGLQIEIEFFCHFRITNPIIKI